MRRYAVGKRVITGLLASAAALAASASPLAAEGQPPAPPPPTREEIEGAVQRPQRDAPARLQVDGELARAPCALDQPEFSAIRFRLTGANFAGLRGLAAADLRPAYDAFLNTDQPIAVVCEIRDRAAAILRAAGYIAAVEVPEQRIEDGRVQFRVLMARLVGLRVRGDGGRNERLITRYLERLTDQEVFNSRQAERYLLLAGDLPGFDVRLSLRPAGTVPGEVVGEVRLVRVPASIDVNVQNFGSRAIGRFGGLVRGQLNGLTGLGDRTVLAVYSTFDFEEQQTVQLAHDFRIGGEGLMLGGQITYSEASPSLDPMLELSSRTLFATLEARYPVHRAQHYSVHAGGGIDIVDQEVDFFAIPLTRDRLRVLFARLDVAVEAPDRPEEGRRAEPRWRFDGRLELRQGIDGLGASERCDANFINCTTAGAVPPSRLEGRPDATLFRGQASGEFRPIPQITFFLGATTQYTTSSLLSFEEYSAGNYTVGRGYDPATIIGDRGGGLQFELRYGDLRPNSPRDLAVQPYAFVDAAWVENEDRFAGRRRDDLQSIGAGLRAVYGDRAQLDLVVAVPLARAGTLAETPDPRILLSLTTRLLPWTSPR